MFQNFKIIKYSILLSLFININSKAQTFHWQNTIGGNDYEWVDFIELTNDGNYISGGYSYSNISGDKTENSRGEGDFWFIKIDDITGNVLWEKTIGGNHFDHLTSAKQTADGGYILGGYSSSGISGEKTQNSRGDDDYWIVKLDANRNVIWDKTYGGTGTDRLTSIIQTADGGYLIGGSSDSDISGDKNENSRGLLDMWIIKVDASGTIIWQKTFGGNDYDIVESMIKTVDGNYVLAGSSASNISGNKNQNSRGIGDYWVLKIDALGTIIWQKTIGGDNGDHATSIVATPDGSYIIGGESFSNISGDKTENTISNSTDIWLIKLNNNGQLLWQKDIGGNDSETLEDMRLTSDNGLILGSMSYSGISGSKTEVSRGERDYWIIKLDQNGLIEWDKTLGGDSLDQTESVIQAKDGGFVTIGWSQSNISGDKTENKSGLQDFWAVKIKVCSQNVSAISNSPICVGKTINLKASGGTSYAWTGPNGFTSTDQNPTIPNATAINNGKYSCNITGTGGCDGVFTVDVVVGDTVAPIPNLSTLPTISGDCNTTIITIPTANDACAGTITATTINPLSYSLPGTYTVVWDYDDGNNNISHQNQTVNINNQPLPTANSPQSFCIQQNATLNDITITSGQNLKWYDALSAGNVLPTTTALENKTYYVSQSNNNCESLRLGIAIKIQDSQAPVADANQRFCAQQNATLNSIKINGQNIKWYNSMTGGTILSESTPLESGIIYYASQTINDCESDRTPISIQIQEATNADCINFEDELPFPKFFTPNSDGYNDTWTIDFAYLEPNSVIRIFDRYGKLIKILVNNSSWNGNYLNQPLPSTDYWFVVTRKNGKEYKGHFSLKR